jgi:hypothetical protein
VKICIEYEVMLGKLKHDIGDNKGKGCKVGGKIYKKERGYICVENMADMICGI